MALKMAVVAPIPRPTVAMMVSAIIGDRSRPRSEMRKSWTRSSSTRHASHAPLLLLILLTAVLARPLEIAELPERLAPGVGGRHAAGLQLLHPHLQMQLKFLVHVGPHSFRPAAEIPERAARGHVVLFPLDGVGNAQVSAFLARYEARGRPK